MEPVISTQMLLSAFKRVPDPPGDEEAVRLATAFAAAAANDPVLAEELAGWYQNLVVVKQGDVSNTISGSVDRVVQARDVSGAVIFH